MWAEGMYINTAIDTCASDEANKRTAMMVEILMMRSCCDCCGNLRKVLYWNYAENKLLALTWCEAIDCSILAAAVTESWIRPRSHLSKITSILHLQYRVPGTLEESIFWEGTVCIALGTTRHKIYIFFMVFTGSAQKGLRIELVQPKNYQVHWFQPILTYSKEKIIQIKRVPNIQLKTLLQVMLCQKL